jgi:hypothetical protein
VIIRPDPEPSGDLLFHYTDSAGLVGIISTATLWATNVAFLNDSQEMRFGAKLLADEIEHEKVLRYRWSTDGLSPVAIERAEQLTNYFTENYIPERVIHGPYVVCFSRKGNDLGQWRGYAQAGYSIGFDRQELLDLSQPFYPENPSAQPVIYGDRARGIAQEHVQRIFEIIKSTSGDGSLTDLEIHQVVLPAEKHIPYLKHGAFALEDEERLVIDQLGNVKFRPSAIGIVPYLTAPINSTAIREIVVGPGPNQHIRVNAVKILLEGFLPRSHIEVITSAIPFRG